MFLLLPDEETNNAFVYCLAEAAERFAIELIASQQMSNHHHTVLFDRQGRVVEFMAHFHKMLAKCQNSYRGRWENMWSTEQPCLVELEEKSDVIDKIVYTATNPVLDNLVERVHHWPGAKLVKAMLQQEPLRAHRPAHFFQEDGLMPETVELRFVIPPELGDAAEVIEEVRTLIAKTEQDEDRECWVGVKSYVSRGATRQRAVNHVAISGRELQHGRSGTGLRRSAETLSS